MVPVGTRNGHQDALRPTSTQTVGVTLSKNGLRLSEVFTVFKVSKCSLL